MTYRELQRKYMLRVITLKKNGFLMEKYEIRDIDIIEKEKAKNFAKEYIKDLFDIRDDNKHFIDCEDPKLVFWEINNDMNNSSVELYFTLDNKINGKIVFSGINDCYQLDNSPLIRFTDNILDKEINFNNTLNILLLQTAENNNLERLKLLVDEVVDINIRDEYGKTALRYAVENGHLEVVKYLIDKGADINVKDNYGKTALTWASRNGHLEVAEFLKSKGAK